MKSELEQELYVKYPELFYQRHLPITQGLMSLGLEIGDGWYSIIDSTCQLIKSYLQYKADLGVVLIRGEDFYKLNSDDQDKVFVIPEFNQVKEKFGELRMYVSNEDDYIRGIIDMAEIMSRTTCQYCGKPSEIKNNGGWLDNECNFCIRKRKRRAARKQTVKNSPKEG